MNVIDLDKQDRYVIQAYPEKGFYIHNLTKDIELIRAILDLVDNSVDGARRLRPDGDFNGLLISITVDANHFEIADNCGGMPADMARTYAFHFGRPQGMPTTAHSVGQFGVGMKRALFKLGNDFRIESKLDFGHLGGVIQHLPEAIDRGAETFLISGRKGDMEKLRAPTDTSRPRGGGHKTEASP